MTQNKQHKKHPWRKLIFVVLGLLIAIVGVPIGINECYKTNTGYITVWNGSDVLSYYGTILAATGGITGVYFTVRVSQTQYSLDKRRAIMPFFAINILDAQNTNTRTDNTQLIKGEDCIYSTMYFMLSANDIKYTMTFSDNINAFHIPLVLQNVGQGCAINAKITVHALGESRKAMSDAISIPVTDKLYVHLYFTDDLSTGRYDLRVHYYDIYENLYIDHKLIEVNMNMGKGRISITEDTVHYLQKENNDA